MSAALLEFRLICRALVNGFLAKLCCSISEYFKVGTNYVCHLADTNVSIKLLLMNWTLGAIRAPDNLLVYRKLSPGSLKCQLSITSAIKWKKSIPLYFFTNTHYNDASNFC